MAQCSTVAGFRILDRLLQRSDDDLHAVVIDPLTGAPLEIGASGEMNLQVKDARKLLIKLVGTTAGIAWGEQEGFAKSLQNTFRPLIVNAVKANLPAVIKAQQIDLLEIDESVAELSQCLREKILPGFEEYGLKAARRAPQFSKR